eukprot:1150842-Pelagomonas_calceolata.AAC.1
MVRNCQVRALNRSQIRSRICSLHMRASSKLPKPFMPIPKNLTGGMLAELAPIQKLLSCRTQNEVHSTITEDRLTKLSNLCVKRTEASSS